MEEKQHAGKQHVALLMQRGTSWKEAATAAGVHISRSTAYRWRSRLHVQGEAAFQDGRHGHLAKLREPVRTTLEAIWGLPSVRTESWKRKQDSWAIRTRESMSRSDFWGFWKG